MNQEVPTVTDAAPGSVVEAEERETTVHERAESPEVDPDPDPGPGPGASESGFAVRFGGGFAIGMLAGGVVGVVLNSLPLAMFGGFILGTLVGIGLAIRD
jgi:predicted lipid-binding transport protein (Tim44 family)